MEEYKCSDCGAPMNEGEAKTFTCCEACWDKKYPPDNSNRVDKPVKPNFCDNTLRLDTTELDILIDVFEGATKNIDQYRVLNRLLKHKLKIIESINKNSV